MRGPWEEEECWAPTEMPLEGWKGPLWEEEAGLALGLDMERRTALLGAAEDELESTSGRRMPEAWV